MRFPLAATFAFAVIFCAPAFADLTMPAGFTVTDGALVSNNLPKVSNNPYMDLALAATGDWTTAGPSGNGVYDPDQWAVVYKFSSVNINHGTGNTLTFRPHPSGAPVIWLVDGNVTIGAPISLNGENARGDGVPTQPGPGGFGGGSSVSGGLGPGGGGFGNTLNAGSHRTRGGGTKAGATYGNALLFPLLGGSGAAGTQGGIRSGGAGGGAILIYASGAIVLNGSISANGGSGYLQGGWNTAGGSGGGIRLVADTIAGSGNLTTSGGDAGSETGGGGRVRIEAVTSNLTISTTYAVPANGYTYADLSPGDSPKVFLDDDDPRVRAVKFTFPGGGEVPAIIPADPRGFFALPADVKLPTTGSYQLHVDCENVPIDWVVTARFVLVNGTDFQVAIPFSSGTQELSHWIGTVSLPAYVSAVHVRADAP